MRYPFARLLLGLCLLSAFSTTIKAEDAYTLQQILSSPFPGSMEVAEGGSKIAWVRNDQGRRNIWVAERPGYTARQITQYNDDDGQVIRSLTWTIDGNALIYIRGGSPNRSGEIPNPLSDPEGTKRQIWMIDLEGGEPKALAEGTSPLPAPDGSGLVYMSKGQVWWIALGLERADSADDDLDADEDESENQNKPKAIIKARGSIGSLRFSPDGSKLAFVSSRGDHGYIGVYDFTSRRITYLDPGVDRDMYPAWSSDGASIAFMRIPAAGQTQMFAPRREASSWSIRLANVETGSTRKIWKAEKGVGSAFHSVSAENQLLWGDGDRIVFPWERDGWLHLYSIGLDSSAAVLLTPGAFEVEDVTMTPDGKAVMYSSNQDDIDRRHLWQVSVQGGKPHALTRGKGIEFAPAPLSDDGLVMAFLRSGAGMPAHAAIRIGAAMDRPLIENVFPESFPLGKLVEPQQVIFTASDGMKIHGQLFLPPDHKPGQKHPAMLFFHGGSRRQMFLGFHNRGYYHNTYAFNQFLASRGYVVMSVNYRSGIGYGLEFREALNYGATGASEFNDVLGAGLYLQSRDDVDGKKIGLWGGSYGGYLTALGLARASDLFAAGVDLHGVHDWNVTIAGFRPSYKTVEHPEAAKLAFDSSPMAAIDTWRSPVLLIHGDDDRNVPFAESVTLTEKLRKRNVEVEHLVFPDEVHGFLLHRNWLKAYSTAYDFLERKLKQ